MQGFEGAIFPGGYSPFDTKGDCWFDQRAATNAVNFFPKMLRHVKGALASKPMALEPWQQNIVATLSGWKRPDGSRRYRQAYIEIPRKAGKSTISAGIALLGAYLDREPGAEIYSCASDRDQAAIVFEIAKQNVLQNPALDNRSTCYQRSITITDPKTGIPQASYKVLSSEAASKHGYNPHIVIFDELHAQPNADLYEVMKTGMGARRQPLMIAITTAGFDRQSICYQQRELAEKVRDGVVQNEQFLPVIYSADKDDDWTDPAVWRKAQPNLGVSVPESFYRDECLLAQQSPAYENTFKRLYLNIWTEQETRWLSMESWLKCGEPFDVEELAGQECFGGLDMASVRDIAAFVLYFPSERYNTIVPWFWIPEDTVRIRTSRDGVPYRMWVDRGLIETTPGGCIDHDFIFQRICQIRDKFDFRTIAKDPWNSAQIGTQLDGVGFNVMDFRQGYLSFNSPCKEFERQLLSGELRHGGHPVLEWMARNVVAKHDPAGNIKPDKQASKEKIDGIVGAIMAIGGWLSEGQFESIYGSEGGLSL